MANKEAANILQENKLAKTAIILRMAKENKLAKNVFNALGGYDEKNIADLISTLRDILESPYGMAAGFNGFVYIDDTCAFFDKNKTEIFGMLAEQAWEFDYKSEIEMVNSFNGVDEKYTLNDFIIASKIKGWADNANPMLKNILAWYAASEIARKYEYECECGNVDIFVDDVDE